LSSYLNNHLVLNKYFLNLFGYKDFKDLREKLKDVPPGFDSSGRSLFLDKLLESKFEKKEKLFKYDENIREYVERMRKNRKHFDFNLKYFQYLAILFSEIYLDLFFNKKPIFINDLNDFLSTFNEENNSDIPVFTEEDLDKLAYWMATGSGKTLIMHINYWQILRYSKNDWDNIILITPNEGLSKQHYEEMVLSGIPCKLYDGNVDNLKTKKDEVLIIDIYKLTEEKKGSGVSIDVTYFDGKNLVFIDEGHKGASSQNETGWKNLRETIAKNGFIFEYSATFGQIIQFTKTGKPSEKEQNKELYEEYTKSIIFDYSYYHFYIDGYGKDFYVYNIKDKNNYNQYEKELLLTANLLSFCEQIIIYEQNKDRFKEYNIEKPLWVFVGSKVTGKGLSSDINIIIQFIKRVLEEKDFLRERLEKVLSADSSLIDAKGDDIFKNKFKLIREFTLDTIIAKIYQIIFGGKGSLKIYKIKNADGELGLASSTAQNYFGVINVGDVNNLEKLLKESGIEVLEDHLSSSLFLEINDNNSPINILIGSKKFIEGWNSWRVSNMGLINMGKSEGPQIIQLFGRGVRFKGRNYSLKREENPDYELNMLQTLFIFGLNADYIDAFLSSLEREDLNFEEFTLPIKFNSPDKWANKIYTLETKKEFNFLNVMIILEIDKQILGRITLDLRPKISLSHGLKTSQVEVSTDESINISDENLEILDWEEIYFEIVSYKISKGMYNLSIEKDILKQLIESSLYKLYLYDSEDIKVENRQMKLTTFSAVKRLQDIVIMILKEYISKFYLNREKQTSMQFIEAKPLNVKMHSEVFPKNEEIVIKIPKEFHNDIEILKKELESYQDKQMIPKKWTLWNNFIVHFDHHLYTPLIIWQKNKDDIKSIPVKLNEGETKFVIDLKEFITHNQAFFDDKELFLLRNLSKKGIGFFIDAGFYPDFIMWLKFKDMQYMIFIDPKGIRNSGNFNDSKIQLCSSYIKEIETEIKKELSKNKNKDRMLIDAFIISVTKYNDIKATFGEGNYIKKDFEDHNILFQEDNDYIEKIFKKIGAL